MHNHVQRTFTPVTGVGMWFTILNKVPWGLAPLYPCCYNTLLVTSGLFTSTSLVDNASPNSSIVSVGWFPGIQGNKNWELLASYNRESNGTPLQHSCLENPMDGGAWSAAVHGVAKSRTRLSDFTFTFHFHALEKEMATHSSVLAWRIPGTGEPGGLLFMG